MVRNTLNCTYIYTYISRRLVLICSFYRFIFWWIQIVYLWDMTTSTRDSWSVCLLFWHSRSEVGHESFGCAQHCRPNVFFLCYSIFNKLPNALQFGRMLGSRYPRRQSSPVPRRRVQNDASFATRVVLRRGSRLKMVVSYWVYEMVPSGILT